MVLQAGDKVIDAIDYTDILCPIYVCQRPYCAEHTRSHQNSEVKQRKARSVLGWGTAWEVLRVLLAFVFRHFAVTTAEAAAGPNRQTERERETRDNFLTHKKNEK